MIGPFRVIWNHQSVNRDVANIVFRVMERRGDTGEITRAMAHIDQLLSIDPIACSESRADHERILIVEPLAVDFEFHEEEKIVYVLRARYAPKRKK